MASIIAPAVFIGLPDDEIKALSEYAGYIGVAFQIKDDILDVEGTSEELGKSVGSDAKNKRQLMYHYMVWMEQRKCFGM